MSKIATWGDDNKASFRRLYEDLVIMDYKLWDEVSLLERNENFEIGSERLLSIKRDANFENRGQTAPP